MTTAEPHPAAASAEMPPAYEPQAIEEQIYRWWEARGFFKPAAQDPGTPKFTVIMPPPNLTGELHMGHALTDTIEDALVRWHRMRGDDTVWVPGVDHAAIAVNTLVERQIRAEGQDPRAIGRDAFLERVWQFVNRSRDRIFEQHRRLGASADWDRMVFTMDPGPQRAVRETFARLHADGLIYRGERLINWCPDCRTALSDLEVEHEDEAGSFWHIRYPVLDDAGQPTAEALTIATTRPETIPADVAVAVHPDDDRYRHLIGRRVQVPIVNRAVPVIADTAVSIEGGSGALKVTPGHDPVDFEIGERHGLPIINLMAEDGTLTAEAGPYATLDRFVARERIVADMQAAGLLERIEPYTHAIGHCQRSRTIVEPLMSKQWFIRMEPLATPAIEAVRDGRIRFVPPRFERTYFHWMEHIRDWCISRQIWWGHRIPVWYCDACEHQTVAVEDPTACSGCGSTAIRQDEDTLDTWFSSGLWPHSALGWPDPEIDDVRRFYPTQVMETGYDIIFFWVARMIMMSLYNMNGVVPFDTVYLHGLVRAEDGSKMSKSKGNAVDPIRVLEQFGTDALRFALVSSTSPGNDQRISDQRLEAGRNFANKLWNASRFALSLVEPDDDLTLPAPGAMTAIEDRWLLSRLERLTATVTDLLEKYELSEATRQLRDFFWDEFADWYIELAKVRLRAGDRSPLPVLVHALDRQLRLLHPVMPFVTEAIWGRLQAARTGSTHPAASAGADPAPALICARYPATDPARVDDAAERTWEGLQEFVRGIRNVRSEKQVEAARWVEAYIVGADLTAAARDRQAAIEALARVRPLHIVETAAEAPTDGVVTAVLPVGRVVLPMAGLFDLAVERQRLTKQLDEARGQVAQLEGKLGNEQFRSRAPADVVAKEEERLATARTRVAGIEHSLAELG